MTDKDVWVKATQTADDGGDYVRVVVDGTNGPESAWVEIGDIRPRTKEPQEAAPPTVGPMRPDPYDVEDAVHDMGLEYGLLHYGLAGTLNSMNGYLRATAVGREAVIAAVASTILAWRMTHPGERYYGE